MLEHDLAQGYVREEGDAPLPKRSTPTKLPAIRTFDAPVLKQVCEPCKPGDKLDFLYTMRAVCLLNRQGVGLAASQIGIAKRAVVICPPRTNRVTFMVNPFYTFQSTEVEMGEEGCLSYPGVRGQIERHWSVVVRYTDEAWKIHTDRYVGFEARIVQHEMDHLVGECKVAQFRTQAVTAPLA